MKKQNQLRVLVLFLASLGLLPFQSLFATVSDVESIANKTVGDTVFHSEFNAILNTIKGIYNQDSGTNIGIGAAPSSSLKLDIDGKVGATEYCNADGSACTAADSLGGGSGGKFISGTNPDDAVFMDGNVGIGTLAPATTAKLEVAGRISQTELGGSVFIGEGAGVNDSLAFNQNVFIGGSAGNANSTGKYNVALGSYALSSNTTGYWNTALGNYSLNSNTFGSYNTASGVSALYSNESGTANTASGFRVMFSNTTGSTNAAFGNEALYSNTTGSYNIALGSYALTSNTVGTENTASGVRALSENATGSYNTAVGTYALQLNNVGAYNTAVGRNALTVNTAGTNNTAIGNGALSYNILGSNNVAFGSSAGRYISDATGNKTGSYNVFLGTDTKALADGDQNEIVIGYDATGLGSNTVVLGGDAITKTALKGSVGIGTTNPDASLQLDVNGKVGATEYCNENGSICKIAGDFLTMEGGQFVSGPNPTNAVFLGGNVGIGTDSPQAKLEVFGRISQIGLGDSVILGGDAGLNSMGSDNVFVGHSAGEQNMNGASNVFVGKDAGSNSDGSSNVFVGQNAGKQSNNGNTNVFVGKDAGFSNGNGDSNVFLGNLAGSKNSFGSGNVFIGNEAANYDSMMGNAMSLTNSVHIGGQTKSATDGSTNEIVIGYDATGLGSNTAVLGSDAITKTVLKGSIGIGTTNPDSKLSVVGLPSGTSDSVTVGSLVGALCITNSGNVYIDTDGTCAN